MPTHQTTKKIKILYLITLSQWGGAQKYVTDLASYSKRQPNFEVSVAFGGEQNGQLKTTLEQNHITTHYLHHLQRQVNVLNDWRAFWQIVKLYQTLKPDIVHLNSSKAGALGAIASICCRVKIKKIIYTVHGLVLNEPLNIFNKTFYWLAEWLSAKFKTRLIAVSEYDKQKLLHYKICPAHKITLIHNGIRLKNLKFLQQHQARLELKKMTTTPIHHKTIWLGTVANLYPAKGLPYLIQAMRYIKSQDNHIVLFIIGYGPLRKNLTNLTHTYQLEGEVVLVGEIKNAYQYLKAFDLFILPSVKEGLSYTLMEALAAQLPILTTQVGGNAEIVEHQKNGLLVQPRHTQQLAEQTLKLLNHPPLCKKFAKNNSNKAKYFDIQNMFTQTKKIYLN